MDLDADGHKDILSGSYSRFSQPMAGLFQVLYGKPDGTFRKAEVLNGTDGNPLIIPATSENTSQNVCTENICTRPFAVDWDGDGNLDLVVGNFAGTLFWFKGEGNGKFAPNPEPVRSGDKTLKILGYHSDPFAIDWDGDGDLDLLSGSSEGGVQWAKNTAGKGKIPTFAKFEWIIPPVRILNEDDNHEPTEEEIASTVEESYKPLSENDLKGPRESTRVWVADVNGDGKLDLLVGDTVRLVERAKGLSSEEFEKKRTAWSAALRAAHDQVLKANPEDRQKLQVEYQEIYAQRSKFVKEDDTGFVWLYLGK